MFAKVMKTMETMRVVFVILLELAASVIIIDYIIRVPLALPVLLAFTLVAVIISRKVVRR